MNKKGCGGGGGGGLAKWTRIHFLYKIERGFDFFEGALYIKIHILISKLVIN